MAEIWIRIISIWCPACGLLLLGITKRNSSRMREREVEAHGTKKGKHYLKPCFSLIFFCPFFICFRGCESNSAWKKPYAWPAPSVWQLPKRAMQCWLFHIASHSQNFIFHFQSQSRIECPVSCNGSLNLSGQPYFSKRGCAWGGREKKRQQGQAPATLRQDALNQFPAAEIGLSKIAVCMEPKPRAQA